MKFSTLLKEWQEGSRSDQEFFGELDRIKQKCPRREADEAKIKATYPKVMVSLLPGVKVPKVEPVVDYRYKD